MIAELISKLAGRKAQATQVATKDWQNLVVKFVDQGDKADPDHVLSELDRMGRTLEDLESAAELLTKRRGWATQLDAGTKAESDYPKLTRQIEDAHAELKRMEEAHNTKYSHLDGKVMACRDAINAAGDAKRQLLATAGEETRRAATVDIDQKILELEAERNTLRKRLEDRRNWINRVGELAETAATVDQNRLEPATAEFQAWQEQDRAIGMRFEDLQRERNRATAVLLKPESI